MTTFVGWSPGNPEYDAALSAFALLMASGDLSAESMDLLTQTMDSQGLVYDPNTLAWVAQSSEVALPDSGPLLAAYAQSTDRAGYFTGLGTLEKASLFAALSAPEDKILMADTFDFDTSSVLNYNISKGQIENFLRALPDGQAALALNEFDDYTMSARGPNFIGQATYGDRSYSPLTGLNLSGVDLTGLNTVGKSLSGVNLVGATISIDQLNAASSIGGSWENMPGTNLSNRDLTGLETMGKELAGINFTGTNISADQLNAANSNLNGCNFAGVTLDGLSMAGRSFEGVNFSGSSLTGVQLNSLGYGSIRQANLSNLDLSDWDTTGVHISSNLAGATISVAQLSAAASLTSSNLSNRDLTQLDLTAKTLYGVNFTGATITLEQLVNSAGVHGVILTGTGITRPALEAALSAAGKSGYYFRTDEIRF